MNSIDLRRLDIWQCSECHPQHFLLSPKEPCKHKSLRWRCPGRDAACITAKGRYKHKRNCIYYKEALKDSVLTNALYGNGGTLSAETLNAFSEQQRIHNSPYSKKLFRKKLPTKLKNFTSGTTTVYDQTFESLSPSTTQTPQSPLSSDQEFELLPSTHPQFQSSSPLQPPSLTDSPVVPSDNEDNYTQSRIEQNYDIITTDTLFLDPQNRTMMIKHIEPIKKNKKKKEFLLSTVMSMYH